MSKKEPFFMAIKNDVEKELLSLEVVARGIYTHMTPLVLVYFSYKPPKVSTTPKHSCKLFWKKLFNKPDRYKSTANLISAHVGVFLQQATQSLHPILIPRRIVF